MELVKSVIHGMMLYSFLVYSWPISLLKTVDRWIRNFIWSGDVNQKKICTVSWNKVCSPTKEGGLGLRSLRDINSAAVLKLCWDLTQSNNQWACLLRGRVLRNNKPIPYHVSSSIWAGLKIYFSEVQDKSCCQIGSGNSLDFWTDVWLSQPLVRLLNLPSHMYDQLKSKVSDFINNGKWRIPYTLLQQFPVIKSEILKVCIPTTPGEDKLIWKSTDSGELSFRDAFLFHKPIGQALHWAKMIWNSVIPPSRSLLYWRALHGRLPTDENLMVRGCVTVSMCCLCNNAADSTQHLLCDCIFAIHIWNWLSSVVCCSIDCSSVHSILSICDKQWSSQVRDVILAAVINGIWAIWACRNKLMFENQKIQLHSALDMITASVSIVGNHSKGHSSNSM